MDAYQRLAKQQQILEAGNTKMASQFQTKEDPLPEAKIHTVTLKPKKLFKKLKDEILEALIRGTCKKEVCSECEISISTVNRLLRFNPLVEQQINNTLYLNKRAQQREEWEIIVSQNLSASANDIKQLIPNVYAWLYRNDRSWLAKQTSTLPSGRRGNHVRVDWDSRDENLCSLIKQALNEHTTDLTKIRKRELYEMVPSLFSALEKKSRYPKTRKLLSEIGK
ncbi:TnsD family Tn7-like transposition protein [Pseudomonas gingeri]|uniref:TnsD family Tn7-like transposition protein n=1 Tax=Pseudomonas gingeri TaxID=117681 RepID=UPI002109D7DC|nr:TnsD family Tn7-like transposition protein [Pseudomonas gingeri]